MLTKLNNLASYLDESGHHDLSERVCDLASYCMISKYAELDPNDFFLFNIDDPELAKWDHLLLAIDAPSQLAYEIKGPTRVIQQSASKILNIKDKLNAAPKPNANLSKKESKELEEMIDDLSNDIFYPSGVSVGQEGFDE